MNKRKSLLAAMNMSSAAADFIVTGNSQSPEKASPDEKQPPDSDKLSTEGQSNHVRSELSRSGSPTESTRKRRKRYRQPTTTTGVAAERSRLVPLTTRVEEKVHTALTRAYLENKISGSVGLSTQQSIVNDALVTWLKCHGFLT